VRFPTHWRRSGPTPGTRWLLSRIQCHRRTLELPDVKWNCAERSNAVPFRRRLRSCPDQSPRMSSRAHATDPEAGLCYRRTPGHASHRRKAEARYRRHGAPRAQFPRLRKSRNKCNCDIETGHRSTSATLLETSRSKQNRCSIGTHGRRSSSATRVPTSLLSYKYRAPLQFPG